MTININDVDEFDVTVPVDSDGATDEVAEDAGIGTVVGITAQAGDADATNNTITYTLDDDAGGRFAIDGSTGQITVNAALDYETNTSHNVVVRSASSDGSSSTQSFTINVTDVSEAGATPIVDNDAAGDSVAENAVIGTTVGVTAFSDDVDASDTISYSLDDNDGGRFTIDSATGIVTVAGAIDREADGASRSITVRATSTDGSFQTRIFTIAIDDVDEFDVGTVSDSNAATNEVDENAIVGTTVGITAAASDADATTNTVTYSLQDDDGGRFTIDSGTGSSRSPERSTARRTDRAATSRCERHRPTDLSPTRCSRSTSTTSTNSMSSHRPTTMSWSMRSDENAATNTVVGVTALASDADATNNTITYSLDDTAGGRFKIDSVSGVVTVDNGTLLDREAAASHNITVRATSADGSSTDHVFAININDVDEFDVGAVADVHGASNEVAENAAMGTSVGITASASDVDATTNGITHSLQDDDGGRFHDRFELGRGDGGRCGRPRGRRAEPQHHGSGHLGRRFLHRPGLYDQHQRR